MNTNSRNVSAEQAMRLRHYQGQRLAADDLQDEYDNHIWLRGLHVVGLHNTWGIALGFEVSLAPHGISVAPGFAYDCFGREIMLSQRRLVAFPADLPNAPGGYNLVVRYDADLGQRQATLDAALCCAGGDRPAFAWQRPDQTRLGRDVPLLRVVVLNGQPAIDLDIRRYTQPLARPRVGSGVTPPTQGWLAWNFQELMFLQTAVDTSAAGFVGTPFYTATLGFDVALLTEAKIGGTPSASAADRLPYVFASIATPFVAHYGAQSAPSDVVAATALPNAAGFTFRITLDSANEAISGRLGNSAANARDNKSTQYVFPFMRVSWLGVEPGGGCAEASARTIPSANTGERR